jgi:exopolysaccharide production protein ExoZ
MSGLQAQGASDQNRNAGLQWGRAIAATTIVVIHAIVYATAPNQMTHLVSRFGVTLFFIISGFIMVSTTGGLRFDGLSFLKRRLMRIVPLYYLATFTAVVGVLIMPNAFKDTLFDVKHIVFSLLFLPMYDPGGSGLIDPFLRLGWTLNYEMFFYVSFALLCWLDAVQRAALLTIVFVSLVVIGQLNSVHHTFHDAILVFYTRVDTIGFLCGVWMALWARHDLRRFDLRGVFALVAVAAVILGVIALNYVALRENVWTQIAIDLACTAIVAALALNTQTYRGLVHRVLMLLGDGSYSMYLFHMFAIGAVTFIGARLIPQRYWMWEATLGAAGGVLIGLVVFQLVEKPLLGLMRSMRRADDARASIGRASPAARSAES